MKLKISAGVLAYRFQDLNAKHKTLEFLVGRATNANNYCRVFYTANQLYHPQLNFHQLSCYDDSLASLAHQPALNFPGGHWTIPKGKIEAGEQPEQAAHREFEEETGLILENDLRYLDFYHHDRKTLKRVHIYASYLPNPNNLLTIGYGLVNYDVRLYGNNFDYLYQDQTYKVPELDYIGFHTYGECQTYFPVGSMYLRAMLEITELVNKNNSYIND